MVIATLFVLGPYSIVNVLLGDMPFNLGDENCDVAFHKVRMESPYSCPSRRLLSAPTPLGTFTPADQIGKSEWDHYENTPAKPEQNLSFRNKGDYKFEDTSKEWGLDHVGMSYGSAYGDLDGDD